MPIRVSFFGFLMVAIGLLYVVAPGTIMGLMDRLKTKAGLWFAVIANLMLSIVFIVAAPQCRDSEFIFFIGMLALIKAGVILVSGLRGRRDAFISSFQSFQTSHPLVIRAVMLGWGSFGGLIVYLSGWPLTG